MIKYICDNCGEAIDETEMFIGCTENYNTICFVPKLPISHYYYVFCSANCLSSAIETAIMEKSESMFITIIRTDGK